MELRNRTDCTVFRDQLPFAFIDFDTAHPAPRIWDAAKRRLHRFADAYGLSDVERAELPHVAAERLTALVAWMYAQAAAGHPVFQQHISEGHDRRYLTDAEWIEHNFTVPLDSEGL